MTFGEERVVDLDFADDVALLADLWMVMVALVMNTEEVTQRFGININAKKSETLYSDVRVEDVQLREHAMKTLEEFTYLGSVMTSNRKFTQDI